MTKERICQEPGCNRLGQHMGRYYKTGDRAGLPQRRGRCTSHHAEHQARKKGLSATEWKNSYHSYLKYRKTYCENTDGRLGFTCTTNVFWPGMLDVDHIDGDHTNNHPDNMQTLCKCCHAYKSWREKDYLTPGRKTRKVD